MDCSNVKILEKPYQNNLAPACPLFHHAQQKKPPASLSHQLTTTEGHFNSQNPGKNGNLEMPHYRLGNYEQFNKCKVTSI